ncbi:AraC family transcriptional regulator [Chitinophaga sp.]|uniref:AraC family transcriptional regulator n=1 Tax=Chitinophaga sp. TaxID=1869181 RepID=UPI0031D8C4C4
MHQSVEVIYRKEDEGKTGELHFPFFQMAYVISGKGSLGINESRVPYWQGNLMLLTPDDRHHFEIEAETEFLLVRFYTNYIKEYSWRSIDHMECILYYASHMSGCILHNTSDFSLVAALVDSILHCIKHEGIYNEDLTINFVNALIVIAARNIALIKPKGISPNADKRILDIIAYIQRHIFSPQQLKVPLIANQFGISDTYLGSYFRQQCGETIQHFISNYKIRLIEHRLKFSDKRIKEIVHEFGFADESHLNKFFKKHKNGISLTAYRKENSKDKFAESQSLA